MVSEKEDFYKPSLADEGLVGGEDLARMKRSWVSHIMEVLRRLQEKEPVSEKAIEAAETFLLRGLATPPEVYSHTKVD